MKAHGYKLIIKEILDNNPARKIAIYPCGSAIGCELMLMIETLFSNERFVFVDNELCRYNRTILGLEEVIKTFSDAIFIIAVDRRHPTMHFIQDDFYLELKKRGVIDSNIAYIYDTDNEFMDRFICYLLDIYKPRTVYDNDAYFIKRGLITKQIFDTLTGKYRDYAFVNFYTEKKLLFPIHSQIYDKLQNTTDYDLYISTELIDNDSLLENIEGKSFKVIIIVGQEVNIKLEGYTKSNIYFFNKLATLYERRPNDEYKR